MQDARGYRGKEDESERSRLYPPKPLFLATNSHEAMLRSGPDDLIRRGTGRAVRGC